MRLCTVNVGVSVLILSLILFFLSGAVMNGIFVPLISGSSQLLWITCGIIGIVIIIAGLIEKPKAKKKKITKQKASKKGRNKRK